MGKIYDTNLKKKYPNVRQETGVDLSYPLLISSDNEYSRTINGAFFDYLLIFDDIIENHKDLLEEGFKKSIRKEFNDTVKMVNDSFKLALSGEISEAITLISQFITDNADSFITNLDLSYALKCNLVYSDPAKKVEGVYFFRARKINNINSHIDRGKMFHVPFESRCLVATQRFSASGMPCLYLADNSYIAMKEIGGGDFDTFVSAFQPTDDFLTKKIVDLTVPDSLRDAVSGLIYGKKGKTRKITNEELKKSLELAPSHLLNIACSVKCEEDGRSFKSEYVIPQLIMYSLKKLNCCGVAYESCAINGNNHMLKSCFAFPALDSVSFKGDFSKMLSANFKLTEGANFYFYSKKRREDLIEKAKTGGILDTEFSKDYAADSDDLFCHFYNKQYWAYYEENIPYYKSVYFAFDEYLINHDPLGFKSPPKKARKRHKI